MEGPENGQRRQESVRPSCGSDRPPSKAGAVGYLHAPPQGSCPPPHTHTVTSPRCCSPACLRPPREANGLGRGKQKKQAQVFSSSEF